MKDSPGGSFSLVTGFTNSFLKMLYYKIILIRRSEEKLTEWYKNGLVNAPIHLYTGQEAVAVGVIAALKPQDKVVSTHRCRGHYLAKGGNLKAMFAEILGKTTGNSRGIGGAMHLFDSDAGIVISAPLVGASIALAVGIALSSKMKSEDKIAVAFFGDGAVEEGIFWESLNFASVHHLPILFVCENNLYATHSPILKRQPDEMIFSRVSPHRVNACRIENANDVINVFKTAKSIIDRVRLNRPAFIEACTYRFKEHWGVGEDWHLGYRSREEGNEWLLRCPLEQIKKVLLEANIPQSEIEKINFTVEREINEAADFAVNSPMPSFSDLISEAC